MIAELYTGLLLAQLRILYLKTFNLAEHFSGWLLT